MRDGVLALSLLGCSYAPSGRLDHREPFTGTVARNGVEHDYVGYSPWPDEFFPGNGSGPQATGIVWTDDGPLSTYLEIPMEGWQDAAAANALVWPMVDPFDEAAPDWFATLSWVEWTAEPEGEQLYRSVWNEGNGTLLDGTLTISDTDWTTFVDGRVQATLTSADFSTRELDVTFSWGGRDP